jgi:lipoprotein-anchoring transpeptidase ErfK/SrfK
MKIKGLSLVLLLVLVFSGLAIVLSYTGQLNFLSQQKKLDLASLTGDYVPVNQQAIFNNRPLPAPTIAQKIADLPTAQVLGEGSGQKRIEIDLTNQRLYAFEGEKLVYNFLISSGKWGRTPTGTFRIWIKLRYTKMEGGSKAINTYYYLPNVPFTMFFSNDQVPNWRGYGIHGTYWHSNFGHPMSHGCVNMKTEEAEQLYYWADPPANGKNIINASVASPGTPIIIYGEAPWD